MSVTTRVLPELDANPHRLGRHVEHDPASKDFAYTVAPAGPPRTVLWQHHGPVLNQGNLGSCTANALSQCLMTGPLYRPTWKASEPEAVKLYELATQIDGIPGQYPPDDTGSSGLGVCKAAKQDGYITGYQHVFGITHAQSAIQTSPFCAGTEWLEGMFTPDANGFVSPTGQVAGGHEYLAMGWDPLSDVWTFLNSWGKNWSLAGVFHMHGSDFANLLANQGDIVVPVR